MKYAYDIDKESSNSVVLFLDKLAGAHEFKHDLQKRIATAVRRHRDSRLIHGAPCYVVRPFQTNAPVPEYINEVVRQKWMERIEAELRGAVGLRAGFESVDEQFNRAAREAMREEIPEEVQRELEKAYPKPPPDDSHKKYKDRHPSYGKGQLDRIYDKARQRGNGRVICPRSGKELPRYSPIKGERRPWDAGHIPDHEYEDMKDKYMRDEITEPEFESWYRDPRYYRPEHPPANSGGWTNEELERKWQESAEEFPW